MDFRSRIPLTLIGAAVAISAASFAFADDVIGTVQPHASVAVLKPAGIGFWNKYFMSATEQCADMRPLASMKFPNASRKVADVAAGQRMSLLAQAFVYSPYTGRAGETVHCEALLTFTPEAAHTYELTAAFVDQCSTRLVDDVTGAPPPDLTRMDGSACIRAMQRAENDRRLQARRRR